MSQRSSQLIRNEPQITGCHPGVHQVKVSINKGMKESLMNTSELFIDFFFIQYMLFIEFFR